MHVDSWLLAYCLWPPTVNLNSVHLNVFMKIECLDVQWSKAREQTFQLWKLLAVVLDTHLKCVDKVHKILTQHLLYFPQVN